jgi:hypothetical protein
MIEKEKIMKQDSEYTCTESYPKVSYMRPECTMEYYTDQTRTEAPTNPTVPHSAKNLIFVFDFCRICNHLKLFNFGLSMKVLQLELQFYTWIRIQKLEECGYPVTCGSSVAILVPYSTVPTVHVIHVLLYGTVPGTGTCLSFSC